MNGKRIVFWSAIAALVAIAGIAIAGAESHRGWCGYHSAHRGWGGPVALGYVTHKLDLNQAQRKQIRSIWDAEKPAVSSLVAEFASEEKEMDQATAGGVLDGAKVQEIAARQGATVSRLLVERAQLESKIYSTVLTPEQRTRADKMKEQWQDRMERMVNHAAVGK